MTGRFRILASDHIIALLYPLHMGVWRDNYDIERGRIQARRGILINGIVIPDQLTQLGAFRRRPTTCGM